MNVLEIQKYGGTSMANAEAMCQSASVVSGSRQTGKAILVVVSAMSGVTEQLRNAVNTAIQNGVDDELPGSVRGIGSHFGGSGVAYPEIFRTNAIRHIEQEGVYLESSQVT